MDPFEKLKQRLDEAHQWPESYLFKFVVPSSKKGELLSKMPGGLVHERLSSSEKYVSVSLHAVMNSSDEVVAVYREVSSIEGIVTL